MSRKKNVFISHVNEDDEMVGELKDLIKAGGYDLRDSSIVKSKPNQARNDNYIKSEILAPRIKWAGTMIVLVSPSTPTSTYVDWEIDYAHKSDTRIVGVWARGAKESDLPINLELYAEAMVGWDTESIIEAIKGNINNWTGADGGLRKERDIPRYGC